MFSSIRWRIQIWYSTVLVASLALFAVLLYVEYRRKRFVEIDSELQTAGQAIAAELRQIPGFWWNGNFPGPYGGRGPFQGGPGLPGPGGPGGPGVGSPNGPPPGQGLGSGQPHNFGPGGWPGPGPGPGPGVGPGPGPNPNHEFPPGQGKGPPPMDESSLQRFPKRPPFDFEETELEKRSNESDKAEVGAKGAGGAPGGNIQDPNGPSFEPRDHHDGKEGRRRDFQRGNDMRPGGREFGEGPPRPRPPEDVLAQLRLPNVFRTRVIGDEESEPYFVVWRPNGEKLRAEPEDCAIEIPNLISNSRVPQSFIRPDGYRREFIATLPNGARIIVGRSIRSDFGDMQIYAFQLVGLGALISIVGLTGGWWISKQIVKPIQTISKTASTISATSLSNRIETESLDEELQGLGDVLNSTFARLEREFEKQSQFTADASHELRTPLAILQSSTELALSRERSPEDYRNTLMTCQKVAQRMRDLTEGLLMLARADSHQLQLRKSRVNLVQLIQDVKSLSQPSADKVGLSIHFDEPSERVEIDADGPLIYRIVGNLVDNAIRYSSRGGSIVLQLTKSVDRVDLVVQDSGIGISAQDLPHIFERFYRADKARARESGGVGLGLAICKSLVEAHGGTIRCESQEKAGTTFTISFPFNSDEPT